jgi:hypothetical protein
MKCKHHPRYLGKRKPRLACAGCWYVFFWATQQQPLADLRFNE